MASIIKGQVFECIKTVIMDVGNGQIAYEKGFLYLSEKDNCITDLQDDIHHNWAVWYFDKYFRLIQIA